MHYQFKFVQLRIFTIFFFILFSTQPSSVRAPFQQKKTTFIQRQQSPNLIVRQVYSAQAAAPPTVTNSPTVVATNPQTQHVQRINLQSLNNTSSDQIGTASIVNNGNGQYVLVQRTGIIQESGQQRASSAPPSSRLAAPGVQNQVNFCIFLSFIKKFNNKKKLS